VCVQVRSNLPIRWTIIGRSQALNATKNSKGHRSIFRKSGALERRANFIKWFLWDLATNLLADAELVDPRRFAATANVLRGSQKVLNTVIGDTEDLKKFEPPGLTYPGADEVDQRELLEIVTEGLKIGWWSMQTNLNLERLIVMAKRSRRASLRLLGSNPPPVGMSNTVTVNDLFKSANLSACGPIKWGDPVTERSSGVYVISLARKAELGCGTRNVDYLDASLRTRWLQRRTIIYIGRTKRPLTVRIREFFRHQYGDKVPHRGGQAVLKLKCPLWRGRSPPWR